MQNRKHLSYVLNLLLEPKRKQNRPPHLYHYASQLCSPWQMMSQNPKDDVQNDSPKRVSLYRRNCGHKSIHLVQVGTAQTEYLGCASYMLMVYESYGLKCLLITLSPNRRRKKMQTLKVTLAISSKEARVRSQYYSQVGHSRKMITNSIGSVRR